MLAQAFSFLNLDNGGRNFSESRVGKSDNRNVLNRVVCSQEVLNLNRIDVLSAGDDNVLFAVYKVDKSVLVAFSHIAGIQPAVTVKNLVGSLSVLVVALHNARALNRKLANAVAHFVALGIDNLNLPAVTGYADCAYLMSVFYSEVNAARAD